MNEQDGVQEKKIEEHYETVEEKLKSIIDIPSTNEVHPTNQDNNRTDNPPQSEDEKPDIKKEEGQTSEMNKEVKENNPQEDTTSKEISRNINKKTLSDDDNGNSFNNSSNEIKTKKEFYTSKQTLTASSKKNAFTSYTKTNTFRLNKNSSDFRIGTDKQIDQRIEESLNRMKEQKKKHDEYMKRLKEKYEKNEKDKIKPIPMTLNQKKNNDTRSNSEKKRDFLERMQKNNEVVKKKKEKIKEDKEKKIMAEIKKNVEKEKKLSKEMVNKKINEIYEWDARRKKKIEMQEKMRKEKEQNELKNCFKPQINDSSKKMLRKHLNRSTDNAFERLYKEDVQKRKVKNEILKNIYTPAFKPTLNKKESSIEVRETTSINDYEDYMTNVDIEKMLRVRVNKKRNKKSESEL